MKKLIFILLFYSYLQNSAGCFAQNNDFSMTLSKSFYMTGDAFDDLFISVTVDKGTLQENQQVEIVKKNNTAEKITAVVYKIEDKYNNRLKVAASGQDVIIYLKIKNDKNFVLGYTGDLYDVVKKGQATNTVNNTAIKSAAEKAGKGKATILLNGKEWKYIDTKGYFYTKNNGITKGPANILLFFTKPSSVLKDPAEERVQMSIFTDAKNPKTYSKDKLEITVRTTENGKEKVYSKNRTFDQAASSEITKYTEVNGKAYMSGKFTSEAKVFLCSKCPVGNITITFENLELELVNQ
jgi:hypothetical protein